MSPLQEKSKGSERTLELSIDESLLRPGIERCPPPAGRVGSVARGTVSRLGGGSAGIRKGAGGSTEGETGASNRWIAEVRHYPVGVGNPMGRLTQGRPDRPTRGLRDATPLALTFAMEGAFAGFVFTSPTVYLPTKRDFRERFPKSDPQRGSVAKPEVAARAATLGPGHREWATPTGLRSEGRGHGRIRGFTAFSVQKSGSNSLVNKSPVADSPEDR